LHNHGKEPMMIDAFSIQAVNLEIRLIHSAAKIPTKARGTDAGYDLYAVEDTLIGPGEIKNVSTGIQLSCPPGWYYTIEGRSSLFKHRIYPNRAIIDSTYTGELFVNLDNKGDTGYRIIAGDRIAQITIHKQYDANFSIVQDFSNNYNVRGEKGFGSTGR
jgi:dUTP pyrophosphatase